MEAMNKEAQKFPRLAISRMSCRKTRGCLSWVYEHLQITKYRVSRVPFPEKGEHVGRHGRKAKGQSWSLIAGLPKE